MSCPLPETLSPGIPELTPTTTNLFQSPPNYWGRLLSTIRTISNFDLEKPTFTLGRNPNTCNVVLSQNTFPPSVSLGSISKEHFHIEMCSDRTIRIHDKSRNGTFLNGRLIGKDRQCILQSGDRIAIYSRKLTIYKFISLLSLNEDYLPEGLKEKYEVSHVLGQGACGVVRLVFEKYTCQPYACKRILKNTSNRNKTLNRPENIQKEINILKQLNHPFLISLKEIEETSSGYFIIMDYMEGGELTYLISPQRLSESQVKYLFYQIVVAVQHLHSINIIHRDLKPENILLKKESDKDDNMIKISDFGLSKMMLDQSFMKTKCGTPYFSAPEIFNPSVTAYGKKVDVWSLGVILYYMLSQELPFRAPKSAAKNQALAKMILAGKFAMADSLWGEISDNGKNLIKNMLVCDATKRFSIDEVVDHPWFQDDKKLIRKINNLMYNNYQTACVQSESDLEDYEQQSKRIKLSKEVIETSVD
ncbi:myosin light chain kinase A [Onthophagus taurus]|uniref:myosin light chain kinase A n=1 Tax=Onthophagus taurus TaxID=166361 RepID=UPI000C1FF519|nr:myosin light chain kinase A [Onthophagus taurus]